MIRCQRVGSEARSARSKSWKEFRDKHVDFIRRIPFPLRFTGTPEQVRHSFLRLQSRLPVGSISSTVCRIQSSTLSKCS